MKKLQLSFLFFIFSLFIYGQDLNLSYEKVEKNIPSGWFAISQKDNNISIDQKIKQEGSQSMLITNSDQKEFSGVGFNLPKNYDGKKITLSGYLKTEAVDGFAGLWMRIDPEIAFDNMQNQEIKGDNDWKKYEITLPMNPEKTKQIVIGALLVGKGKVWVDDLKISIDGKDISKAIVFEKKLTKVDLDKEFDSGSKISNLAIDSKNVDNLKNLGLIWGYLKYYHPRVAEGNYNWDYELFRILPKINNLSPNKRDEILTNWIKGLGEFETTKIKEPESDKIKIRPDLDWITNSGYSKDLTQLLLRIKEAKRPQKNYYLDFAEGVGNPIFENENAYEKMTYPDEGFRLLSLFRYWNVIQYCFPYKNLIEKDWKNVLTEFIPKFINSKNETEYTLTSLALIAKIHDTHANIWGGNKILTEYFGDRTVPVELTFVGDEAVVKEFYKIKNETESQLLKGDIILEVNGKSTKQIVSDNLHITPASNYPTQLRNIGRYLLRSKEKSIDVKILRDGNTKSLTLKTAPLKEIDYNNRKKGDYYNKLNDKVAYFYLGSIDSKSIPDTMKEIENTKGLVIDLRCYPSDFVVFSLGRFLKPNPTEFVKFSQTSNETPGLFTFTKILDVPGSGSNYYKGKIAILINETTQSQAEYTTMAFRTAPNSKVFGSTTAGADGNVSKLFLPGNIMTMISGIGVYYPDGKETQRIGIVPDVEIKPSIDGIKAGKDEVLEKALEWITQ